MSELPVIPGFRILRELGSGGMATVYLAIQDRLEREVAIKILSPLLLLDAKFTVRFLKEARIAAVLHHANIIPIYDVGQEGQYQYIIMERMEGNLKEKLLQGPMDPGQAIAVLRQIAGALSYAHDRGFIHRDIKPENIMFRADGTAVLGDFGIARAIGSATHLTSTGMSVGTPHYMSPEQAKGKELDGRSDIYSLGIVFYVMLTDKVPFDAEDSIAVAIQHVQEPIPQLPERLSRYQSLLDRLMAKERSERFQSGQEILTALDGFSSEMGGVWIGAALRSRSRDERGDKHKMHSEEPAQDTERAPNKARPKRFKRILIIISLAAVLLACVAMLLMVLRFEANKKDEAAWQDADAKRTLEGYEEYKSLYPSGRHRLLADAMIASERAKIDAERQAWNSALTGNSEQSLDVYLYAFPSGLHASEARERKRCLAELKGAKLSLDEARELLDKAPRGRGTKADIEAMMADLDSLETALAEAFANYDSGKLSRAYDEAIFVKNKADAISDQINAALRKIRKVNYAATENPVPIDDSARGPEANKSIFGWISFRGRPKWSKSSL